MKDDRSPEELMRVAMGGEAGTARQRSKNVATWRQSVAKTNPKVERPSTPSAKHRTVDMNLKTPPQQQTLALGFYLEPQRPTESVLHARPIDNRIGPGVGKKKAPPGDVWWVSAHWAKAFTVRNSSPVFIESIAPVEFTMLGMQLETGIGNQGSKGAMYAHAGREAKRRQQAFLTTRSKCQQFVGWPVRITLTRISPCELDDDNLGTAFKRIRDGICEALGFRDDKNRDGYLQWHYAQEKGGKRKDKAGSAVAHVKVKCEVLR